MIKATLYDVVVTHTGTDVNGNQIFLISGHCGNKVGYSFYTKSYRVSSGDYFKTLDVEFKCGRGKNRGRILWRD